MALLDVTLDEHVAVISMQNDENRFNPPFLSAFLEVLDQVEKDTDARVVVIRSAHEKIFSNGIDLEWLAPLIQNRDIKTIKSFLYQLNSLFRRLLIYPMITVGAVTGHAFAGGAIMSCAFDFRFMRSDRGFFCFPEVDLGIPFLPGMNALLRKAIPMYKLEEMQFTGVRLTAQECEAHHIITKACHMDDLMEAAMAFAMGLKKNRNIVLEMKRRLYKDILHALDVEDTPFIESGKFNLD